MLDKQVLLLHSAQIACLFALSITALYRVISDNLFGNFYSIKTQVTLIRKWYQVTRTRKIRIKADRKEICVWTLKQQCNFVVPLISLAIRLQTKLPNLPSASASNASRPFSSRQFFIAKVTSLNYLMKVHFNVILPTLYQRDILSVITMDLHILRLYGNGLLKKILDLRAME
jgi:hypothetical protein